MIFHDPQIDLAEGPSFRCDHRVFSFKGNVKLLLVYRRRCQQCCPDTVAEPDRHILRIDGIDEIHIGLNDLSMSMGKTFLFEVLTDGTVEKLCRKMNAAGMVYGFGGVACPGHGIVPAEMIVREHYRLGSSMVILSRAFCDIKTIGNDLQTVREIFEQGVPEIRALEKECEDHLRIEGNEHNQYFEQNRKELAEAVCSAVKAVKILGV